MRKHPSFVMLAMLSSLVLVLVACQAAQPVSPAATETAMEEPTEEPSVDYKACMVSDVGGIDDNSFNENAWAGMQDAEAELGWTPLLPCTGG
jgi:basic membrane protein A and related proteins